MRELWIGLIFFSAAFIMCCEHTSAQNADSTYALSYHDTTMAYLSPMEYAFMMHEQTRFMLRLPAIGLGAELEILPYTTIMAEATTQYYGSNILNSELRWYYGSKRMKVRNMSGNYVAAGYEGKQILVAVPDNRETQRVLQNEIYTRWGMQRRFLANGLIDLGILAAFGKGNPWYPIREGVGSYISLRTNASLGLGFVFNDSKGLDRDRICPVIKCFDVEKFLLKINLTDIGSIHYLFSSKSISGTLIPSIALEHKLFNSPFSINLNSKINFGFLISNDSGYHPYNNGIGINSSEFIAEGRWYYNLKRRMRLGKSGNGLSANYLAIGGRQQFFPSVDASRQFNPGYILTAGVQRTIGKRFYFDVQGGIAEDIYRGIEPFEYILDIRAGIKF